MAPFPFDIVKEEISKYKNAKICIAQEEHKNGGAYDETINILVSFAIIINCLANGTYFILLISDNEKNQFKRFYFSHIVRKMLSSKSTDY